MDSITVAGPSLRGKSQPWEKNSQDWNSKGERQGSNRTHQLLCEDPQSFLEIRIVGEEGTKIRTHQL